MPRSRSSSPIPHGYAQDDLPDPLAVVEHLTIPAFLRRCPHRFHLQEIHRFGSEVSKAAESLCVSYLTTIDRQLGMVRLFPVPLLTRVYQLMSTQFGWEEMIEAKPLEDSATQDLRSKERAREKLASVAEHVDNPMVANAMKVVLDWLEQDARRMKGEPEPEITTLRPL